MILGFGDGLTCWFPLAERHPNLVAALFGVPHDGADAGKPHPIADLLDCELTELDAFPAGEPPVFGENEGVTGHGVYGWGNGENSPIHYDYFRFRLTEPGACLCKGCTWQGEAVARELARIEFLDTLGTWNFDEEVLAGMREEALESYERDLDDEDAAERARERVLSEPDDGGDR